MFTGIIKEIGKVKNLRKVRAGLEAEISCQKITTDFEPGDSVAVNGCCLTVKEFNKLGFKADISLSTLKSTTFHLLRTGDLLNLEPAVSLRDRLGGHIVTGHVDDTGKISDIKKAGDFYNVSIKIPQNLLAFAAPKGSFSIDGISLTIAAIVKNTLEFAIIPFTFENTNLKFKKRGDLVNLEVDLMARYIINMARHPNSFDGTASLKKSLHASSAAAYLKTSDDNDKKNNSKEKDLELEAKLKKYGFK